MSVRLSQLQQDQLLHWIAQGLKYKKQMVELMDDAWGGHVESPDVSYYRKQYQAKIQQIRMELQAAEQRRERNRQYKRQQRALSSVPIPADPHCATCQCHMLAHAG